MKRRTFLKGVAGGAAALGLSSASQGVVPALAQEARFPDLVAVRGDSLTAMFDRALSALGGLERYVQKGETVLVKPNMGWAVPPELAANTNPELVSHIVKNLLNLGAGKVYVFDNTCDNWAAAYRESGLEKAAKEAGATVAPGNDSGYYQGVDVPGAKYLERMELHELYLEADKIINVPVLKNHGGAKVTAAMKNLMGAVWSRGPLHRLGLDETIPELLLYKKPTLNVVDAFRVMLSGGPRGRGDSKYLAGRMLIASEDAVAADAAACAVIGVTGVDAPDYIRNAAERGLGASDLSRLNIQRLTA
ncbi:MAG: DUF362 domain-containing protein [Deltaproteobacteria bacterium]|jgi:uncharacterized protein (DUF362 family)|nr:DUF362 domain-containing protein [Deltaproteobacteria bacterium]